MGRIKMNRNGERVRKERREGNGRKEGLTEGWEKM